MAKGRSWGGILVLIAGVLCPVLFGHNSYLMIFLANTAVFVIAALGLQVIFGWSGMLVLSQGVFLGVGAYVSAMVGANWHWPFLGQALASIVACTVVGVIILPIVRLRAVYFALASFCLGLIGFTLMMKLPFTGGINGLSNLPNASIFGYTFSTPGQMYVLSFILVALVYLVFWQLNRGFFGMKLKAVRENELAARSVGINVVGVQAAAILLGLAAAGLAGSLMTATQGFISPDEFSSSTSLQLVTMLVVGGIGSLPGAVVGAGILYVISTYLQSTAQYVDLIYGSIVVLGMIFLPQGLWGLGTSLVRLPAQRYLFRAHPGKGGVGDGQSVAGGQ